MDEEGREQTTMLHKSASAADTVVQRPVDALVPTQVVTELPPGARPQAPLLGSQESNPRRQNLAAAGGVFAGVSMVAAGSLVALGIVCAVAIYLLLTAPSAPGTIAEAPPPDPVTPEDIEAAPPSATEDPLLQELREGIRFPAEFAFNDFRPMGVDNAAVDQLVGKLERCDQRVRVTGHSDQNGTDLANDTFALARASEVRRILGNQGVDRRRIEVSSAGSTDPEVDITTEEGRAYNRRVIVRCY